MMQSEEIRMLRPAVWRCCGCSICRTASIPCSISPVAPTCLSRRSMPPRVCSRTRGCSFPPLEKRRSRTGRLRVNTAREIRPGLILSGNDCDWQRPWDGEGRIIMAEAACGRGLVKGGDEVTHFGVDGKRLEAVRVSLGNIELAAILGGEFEAPPLFESGRSRTDVDDDIENSAFRALDNLHLAMRRRLEMHAAEGSPARRNKTGCAERNSSPSRVWRILSRKT